MVDEGDVQPGLAHRRPGLHVDGYWHPSIQCHGGHRPVPPPYQPPKPLPPPPPKHSELPKPGTKSEGLFIASSYTAARSFVGEYEWDFLGNWQGGSCPSTLTQGMEEVTLSARHVYRMDVFTLHESLPVTEPVRRTVLRINVPNWRSA